MGLLDSTQALLAGVLSLARTRLELFGAELQEQLTRLFLAWLCAVTVLLLSALAMAFAGVALILSIGEEHRALDTLLVRCEERPGHQRVGIRAAAVLDLLIAYGPRSKTTADEARRAGLRPEQVLEPDSLDEIIDVLRARLRPGDDVLIKGSLAMGMSAVVRGIRAEGEV